MDTAEDNLHLTKEFLQKKLSKLRLPSTFIKWATDKELLTAREILRFTPENLVTEHGLPRSVVAKTQTIIEYSTGCSWADLQHQVKNDNS